MAQGLTCTFPKTHYVSLGQYRAEFPIGFPLFALHSRAHGGHVKEALQKILPYTVPKKSTEI